MERQIYTVGLNHKTAAVEVRERFALSAPEFSKNSAIPLTGKITEAAVLSTCNRVEITAVGTAADAPDEMLAAWAAARQSTVKELSPYVYVHAGREAVSHFFHVASSLDSMILGEPQILGQMKSAYRRAVTLKTSRVILNRLFHRAFTVAKRVRTETAIASSAVSISYAAVELAKRIFGDMSTYTVMLIGAGEMAELAATHLLHAGIKDILVANRTLERAQTLATQFNGKAFELAALPSKLHEADIIISSTGAPDLVITPEPVKRIMKKRKNKPMFFIDIAVPRDIDPAINNLDNVYLYDIDDLKEVVETNMGQRREEARKAQSIVEEECALFLDWLDSLALQPTITDMVKRGERIAHDELLKTTKRLGNIDQATCDAIKDMLTAVIKKMSHDPIMFLKEQYHLQKNEGEQCIDYARRMFNLDRNSMTRQRHKHHGCFFKGP